MARVHHTYPKFRADDDSGVPLAGAQLFTYVSGTTTKKTTYTSKTGGANTNPIILDSNGECDLWYEGDAKLVLAPSGDTDPPVSPYWTVDNVGQSESTIALETYTSNWIKNSSFEIAGDEVTDAENWTFTPDTDNTIERVTTDALHGTACVKVTIGGANIAQIDSVTEPVLAGQKYIIRHGLKSNIANADIDITVTWRDKDDVLVSTVALYDDNATNPTTWTVFEKELTAPATATQAEITITVATNTAIVYFDYFYADFQPEYTDGLDIDGGAFVGDILRVEGNTSPPTTGEGIELSYSASTNAGTMMSYDRDGSAYGYLGLRGNPLTINGASDVENYTVGIGTDSPKAVQASYSALQVGNSAWIFSRKGSDSTSGAAIFACNAHYDTDSSWEYIINGPAQSISLTGGGDILFRTASSGTAGNDITWNSRLFINNAGGIKVGNPTGGAKGAGTLNVDNGIYYDGNRNNRLVMLSTYETITESSTPAGWTTVNNTTLNNAAATHAILLCRATCSETSTTTATATIFVRPTGSGASITADRTAASAGAVGDGTNNGVTTDNNYIIVALDANSDFDYTSAVFGATPDYDYYSIYLVGYYHNA